MVLKKEIATGSYRSQKITFLTLNNNFDSNTRKGPNHSCITNKKGFFLLLPEEVIPQVTKQPHATFLTTSDVIFQ